jgi:hypothetical protein
VAVGTDLGLLVQGQEIKPVPERRQRRSFRRAPARPVERRRKRRVRRGGDDVGRGFAAAEPCFEVHGESQSIGTTAWTRATWPRAACPARPRRSSPSSAGPRR